MCLTTDMGLRCKWGAAACVSRCGGLDFGEGGRRRLQCGERQLLALARALLPAPPPISRGRVQSNVDEVSWTLECTTCCWGWTRRCWPSAIGCATVEDLRQYPHDGLVVERGAASRCWRSVVMLGLSRGRTRLVATHMTNYRSSMAGTIGASTPSTRGNTKRAVHRARRGPSVPGWRASAWRS